MAFALLFLSGASCATLAGSDEPGAELPPPDFESSFMTETGEPVWMRFQMYPECTRFLDDTVDRRRELHLKRFEWFEAARKAETAANAMRLEAEMRQLGFELNQRSPVTCRGLVATPPTR